MTALEGTSYCIDQTLTTTGGVGGTGVYNFGIGGDAALVQGCHFQWDATLAATITIWTSNFPLTDAPVNSAAPGAWIQQNPTAAYTPISPNGAATAATPLVVSIPGGTAGGCDMSFGNIPQKRFRATITVTAAGLLHAKYNGKM